MEVGDDQEMVSQVLTIKHVGGRVWNICGYLTYLYRQHKARISQDGGYLIDFADSIVIPQGNIEPYLMQKCGNLAYYRFGFENGVLTVNQAGCQEPINSTINDAFRENNNGSFKWTKKAIANFFIRAKEDTHLRASQQTFPKPILHSQCLFNLNDMEDPIFYHAIAKRSIQGFSTTYTQFSKEMNCIGVHTEDLAAGWASYMVEGGSKLIVSFNVENTKKLMHCLAELDQRKCLHVMKTRRFIPDFDWLMRNGIGFKIVVQKKGMLFVKIGGASHYELSMDFSLSESVNWINPEADAEVVREALQSHCACHAFLKGNNLSAFEQAKAEYPYTLVHGQDFSTIFDFGVALSAYSDSFKPSPNDKSWVHPYRGTQFGVEQLVVASSGAIQPPVSSNPQRATSRKLYACSVSGCNKTYSGSRALKTHIEGAHSGKSFECKTCNVRFSGPNALCNHNRSEGHLKKAKTPTPN